MASPSDSPALRALRSRTDAQHRDLERTLLIAAPDANRVHYARHVAAMWGWLQPLEVELWRGPWPEALDVAGRALKVRWLEEDLAAARCDGHAEATHAACAAPVAFRSQAQRYGWAYVIEGSMLGGQVLRARLADRLAPWPTRYLQGYGEACGRRWRDFLAALAQDVHRPEQIEEAAEGAAAAFASIAHWLRQREAA